MRRIREIAVRPRELLVTTSQIEKIAVEGLHFPHAQVQVANCHPSRNGKLSARYLCNSAIESSFSVEPFDYPVRGDLIRADLHHIAIRGEVKLLTP